MFTGKKLINCFYYYTYQLVYCFFINSPLHSCGSQNKTINPKYFADSWQCFVLKRLTDLSGFLSSLWVRLRLSTWVGWPFCVFCLWPCTDFGQSLPSVLLRWTITTKLLTTPFPLSRLSPRILQNPTSSCLVRRWWTQEDPALPRILMRPCPSSRPRSELHLLKMTRHTDSPVSNFN